jgi:hypothetical protein
MKIGWIGSENDVFDGFLLEKPRLFHLKQK